MSFMMMKMLKMVMTRMRRMKIVMTMMMMEMVLQVRLPWQMGIFSPRLSKRTKPEEDDLKNLGGKSSTRKYLGGKSSGEEAEGLHHLGARNVGAKI